ncbi:PTS IIA-like nitrogen regulatory protein PtsN [Amorphus orientalis]|uniref:PTS system nitrogen regulatory IIA component n=1 Tax=Amorphus orientalis TaxID=649198 RepID=A0AAE3VNE4_9HYPH|nr:PTS IIA-like nitrogen regulatory protein PtsN [Amorphus orientalis]MDQ0315157.1 PTS system nitrogen regulatory IIA component [Amorphus orientalis]
MELNDLLSLEGVVPALKAQSKKQVLQELAAKAATQTGLPEREIFETLLHRERLGSTGVGDGIAIPHGKLVPLKKIVGVFARLERPVEFDALDEQPVDLVFLLLAPEGAGADHLKALARIARVLRQGETADKLRASRDPAALYALLTQPSATAEEGAGAARKPGETG